MFYVAEDIQPAVDIAVKMCGTVGNMTLSKNALNNVSVATREFGKLWYGDLEKVDVVTILNTISSAINQKVYVLDDQFDFNSPVLTSSN
jgi:hypothetical protein